MPSEDPRHARDVAEKSGYLPMTILAVPVMSAGGEPVGVLELLDRRGQPTYSLADMELLGTFAEQIALVLDLRRSQASLGALVGRALAALGGLPPAMERHIAERAATFGTTIEADPVSRRTVALAELVTTIAGRGVSLPGDCDGRLNTACMSAISA